MHTGLVTLQSIVNIRHRAGTCFALGFLLVRTGRASAIDNGSAQPPGPSIETEAGSTPPGSWKGSVTVQKPHVFLAGYSYTGFCPGPAISSERQRFPAESSNFISEYLQWTLIRFL